MYSETRSSHSSETWSLFRNPEFSVLENLEFTVLCNPKLFLFAFISEYIFTLILQKRYNVELFYLYTQKRQMTPKICLCVIIAYFLNTFCSTKWWTVSDIKSMLLSQKKKT